MTEAEVQELLDRAEQAYADDDLHAARACYRQVLEASPTQALAARALEEIGRVLAEHFTEETVITLAVPLRQLVEAEDASPREALIISRLAAGPLSVGRLAELSQLAPTDLHELLYRYVADGIVATRKP